MHFKRMEIHGFKSFAEPTVIEFDRGITCVVGPNGSGKSNICDAIRWVLGAQSARLLRGDRMEDVIFAGTTGRRSRGMAEVTLVIDNSERDLDIEYSEVAITRRMYRSGESEYLINNLPCRMRDIRELIMDTGIGVEGYSIIGQGKISDIISNNTESIREILEETAGIVMYRSRKAEAERKLSAATGNLDRVEDIIGEIEGRIPGLKEDSEKASAFLELRDKYKELEINITLSNIDGIKEKNEIIEEDINAITKNIDDLSGKKADATEKLNEYRAKSIEADRKLSNLRNEKEEVSAELYALNNKGILDKERLITVVREEERLAEEIAEIDTKIEKESLDATGLYQEKEDRENKFIELKNSLDEAEKSYKNLQLDIRNREIDLEEKKGSIFDTSQKLARYRAEILGVDTRKESIEKRKAAIYTRHKAMEEGDHLTGDDLEKAKEEREGLLTDINSLKNKREAVKEERSKDRLLEKKLADETEKLRIKIGSLVSRKKTFEEMEAGYEGYNKAVKYIMKSDSPGLEGVVAEIIDVPEGFEVAMETAFGQSMQNIVCGTDRDAKLAIEKLKSSRSGRLTFLPMESIRSRGVKTSDICEAAKGFKGYAADRVYTDDKYTDIIEYLIGNVVIMEKMEDAIALSKKLKGGYKIVTLDGELISPSGSITGGKYRNNSANFFERKAEITKLEREISKVTKEVESHIEEIDVIRNKSEKNLNLMIETDKSIRNKENEINAKENEINQINAAIIEYDAASSRFESELAEILKEEESVQGISVDAEAEILRLENLASEIENETEELRLALDDKKQELADKNEELTREKIQLGALESEKIQAAEILSRVEALINSYKTEKKQKENRQADLSKEKENIQAGGNDNKETVRKLEEQLENINSNLTQIEEERKTYTASYDDEALARDSLERELVALSNQKSELDIRKTRQETQLENARNKLWEEFDISYAQAVDYRKDTFVLSAAIKENRGIKARLRELGEVNINAIEEYKQVKERYDFLSEQRDDIRTSMDELGKIAKDMDIIIRKKFKESFDSVVTSFEDVFRELYGGGHAKITLSDETKPFDSDIEITAQPPGKQLKHINLLSGGEKTMTAIALMFAVLKTKPTPCCILDEVEAALDDRNLNIFGRYIRNFGGVQFILITHQKSTMEHSDVMYGITMPESGVSKVYSLRMDS